MIFEIREGVSFIHLVELEQETHNPSKNVTYFIISDLFQDKVWIKNSCFWKIKANCTSAGLTSFSADKVMTPFLVLHTDYHILWEFSFRQLSTLQSILLGVFPWEWKQTSKQTNKCWIYGSILKISRYCFSETRVNLAFYVTALSRHIHLMFLSICL